MEKMKQAGIITGVKADKGLAFIPGTEGESSTQGLDGLAERCQEYYRLGARFAKWRAVYKVGGLSPRCVLYARVYYARVLHVCCTHAFTTLSRFTICSVC